MVAPTEIVKHPNVTTRISNLKSTVINQSNIIKTLEKSLSVSESQRAFIDSEYKRLYDNYKKTVRDADEREEYNSNRISGLITALNTIDESLKNLKDKYDELLEDYKNLKNENEE